MRCSTILRSIGTRFSFQNSGRSSSICLRYSTPPNKFLAPGNSPRSNMTTDRPALASVKAAAAPAGPAPTTTASNFSSIPSLLHHTGFLFLYFFYKCRNDLEQIADEPVMRKVENGRVLVFVDGDNQF